MASYPALDIDVDSSRGDLVLAIVDDYSPVALQEREDDAALTIFFPDPAARDHARDAVARAMPGVRLATREVDDEDWARRSQENLGAIAVGRVTVTPPWAAASTATPIRIVIEPSMGFGTGHHATTRLCLQALQALPLDERFVLDVGTGSGVLAIAARLLGARSAIGIDNDPDAIAAARDNLVLNPGLDSVAFVIADLTAYLTALADPRTPSPDVIVANLTGALLVRTAPLLGERVRPDGHLILSGLLDEERDAVAAAFPNGRLVFEAHEDGWTCLAFNLRAGSAV